MVIEAGPGCRRVERPEVRRLLLGDAQDGQAHPADARERLLGPRARRADQSAGADTSAAGRVGRRESHVIVAVHLDVRDGRVPPRLRGPGNRGAGEERGDRGIGIQASGCRIVQNGSLEAQARPARRRLARVQHLGREPGRRDRRSGGRVIDTRAVGDDARRGQQRPTGFGLELAPQHLGVTEPGEVLGLGVGHVEVARGAVRGSADVSGLEPLEHRDLSTRACEVPRGRGSHRAGTDDRDVEAFVAHAGVPGSRRATARRSCRATPSIAHVGCRAVMPPVSPLGHRRRAAGETTGNTRAGPRPLRAVTVELHHARDRRRVSR